MVGGQSIMLCNTTPKQLDEELELVFGADLGRLRVLLHEEVAIAGRGSDCGIKLAHADVSHHHAEIRRLGPALYQLSDLGSRSGTFVNGMPIRHPTTLRLGDTVRFGEKLSARLMLHDPFQPRLQRRRRLLALGRMIGGIANELCNMAAVILSSSEHLAQTAGNVGETADWTTNLSDMEAAASRASRLTKQILAFTGSVTDAGVFDASALCADVAELASHTMGDGVRVDTDIAPELCAPGSSTELKLVLLHCLLEARRALGRQGTLTICALADSRAGTICISIRSEGRSASGMERHAHDGRGATTVSVLSLADAEEVVGEMGGTLRHGPSADGWASTIEIPSIPGRPLLTTQPSRAPGDDSATSLTVLVVDDEPAVRRGLCRLLRRAGHEPIEAGSGREALEAHGSHQPDVVLMDLRLRGEDGAEVLAELLSRDPGVRVVMMSGAFNSKLEADLTRLGAAAFLAKPSRPDEIIEALRASRRN